MKNNLHTTKTIKNLYENLGGNYLWRKKFQVVLCWVSF